MINLEKLIITTYKHKYKTFHKGGYLLQECKTLHKGGYKLHKHKYKHKHKHKKK